MKNNDNCIENYGYKRAKKIIDDANKNVQYYCLVGPTGPRGEKGEQGIQGLKGDKGEKGDQGPKGDSIGLGAYGERYSNKAQTFRVQADQETIIPLEETGQGFFVNYNSSYAIEIKKLGTYQISYILNVATSEDTTYTVSVKPPLYKVPACETKVTSKANQLNRINASAFFGLIEGDEVTLVIKSDKATDLIFEDTINAKLTILKVD